MEIEKFDWKKSADRINKHRSFTQEQIDNLEYGDIFGVKTTTCDKCNNEIIGKAYKVIVYYNNGNILRFCSKECDEEYDKLERD